ncbi:MAG TPA: D-aminoacyl-tRNA deacylase [Candidatus Krumholzibacteria bacterium]|nr:D-aminoacyl-tRNA deacylase [Candidatus Krumholzibacteria bacterium]
MRVVVQRVSEAAVAVDGNEIARIARGFVVLAGFGRDDDDARIDWMARKVASLRIFEDETGRMAAGLEAVGGEILVVSQFTLYGDVRKGARPGFDKSAPPEQARLLYERFVTSLRAVFPGVVTGEFQAHMHVSLVNDGPVTILVDNDTPR